MPAIEVVRPPTEAAEAYPGAGHTTTGAIQARRVSPDGYSLWLVRADLEDGATIEWPAVHGDEGILVVSGSLEIDGKVCPPLGAVVVEADVPTKVKAIGPTNIVHMGPADPAQPQEGYHGAPAAEGHGVHAFGPRGTWAHEDNGAESHYYLDSSCPTCRITLLYLKRRQGHEAKPHAHTEDELIHVLTGEVVLGSLHVGPGDTLAVSANTRYRFFSGDEGFTFINYRRNASAHVFPDPDQPPRLEGGSVNGMPKVLDLV